GVLARAHVAARLDGGAVHHRHRVRALVGDEHARSGRLLGLFPRHLGATAERGERDGDQREGGRSGDRDHVHGLPPGLVGKRPLPSSRRPGESRIFPLSGSLTPQPVGLSLYCNAKRHACHHGPWKTGEAPIVMMWAQPSKRTLPVALLALALLGGTATAWAQTPRAERPSYTVGEKWIRSDGAYDLIRIDNGRYVFAAGGGGGGAPTPAPRRAQGHSRGQDPARDGAAGRAQLAARGRPVGCELAHLQDAGPAVRPEPRQAELARGGVRGRARARGRVQGVSHRAGSGAAVPRHF